MNKEIKSKLVFEGRISKSGNRLMIVIPRKLYMMISHGKRYIVTLEEVGEEKEG